MAAADTEELSNEESDLVEDLRDRLRGDRDQRLLDHFAGCALTGLLSADQGATYLNAADDAYKHAEAMLKAREQVIALRRKGY